MSNLNGRKQGSYSSSVTPLCRQNSATLKQLVVVAVNASLLVLVVRAGLRTRKVLVGQGAFHVPQHGVVQEGVLLLKENSLWLEQSTKQ